MQTITIASKNKHKVDEFRLLLEPLELEVVGLAEDSEESPEDGTTFAANAVQKASFYGPSANGWVLADDSGLCVDALHGAPGVLSARYAGVHGDDAANNQKLLAELRDVGTGRRIAHFVCCLALWNEETQSGFVVTGQVHGEIGFAPAGEYGFGYDPLFIVNGLGCTMAQLSPDEKSRHSHRGQAVSKLLNLWSGGHLDEALRR